MKRILLGLSLSLVLMTNLLANGVCVVDATNGTYLRLNSSQVDVNVENQVAIIKVTQVFQNNLNSDTKFKFAFPLAEQESAISLRWFINNQWYDAVISPTPQDTTLPGGGGSIHPNLKSYLGETPIYFEIEQPLQAYLSVVLELTYVSLLPYEFGSVAFSYPNDYQLIQTTTLNKQQIQFAVHSDRAIESLLLQSHIADSLSIESNHAFVTYSAIESLADKNYNIQYSLSLDELGLFGLSTFLADSLVPDEGDNGFFIFVAEPDPGDNTDVINKVFTLIIDRSGSMSGNKIVQARNAASFIVQNLNLGDKFNIVDFTTEARAFQPEHVEYNATNASSALNYIASLNASESTNISGAFELAIPQFAAADENTANIIIFFTDGQATRGILDTEGILAHVNNLVISSETDITIFTFGIGNDANEQLLTLLASQHNGISEFLGNDELEERITNFYLRIRNPVLLKTQMSFSPEVVTETYPSPLPNLYKGQQMIVAGRFSEATAVEVNLSGEAFGKPVSYKYQLSLSDTANVQYQFIAKIWAIRKIENLLVRFYNLGNSSEEAEAIRRQIVSLSIAFGVVTPFTSFSETPTGIEENTASAAKTPDTFQLLGNYPNPFNPSTHIRIKIATSFNSTIAIKIYNSVGQLIRVLYQKISGPGIYDVLWDGRMQNGEMAASGTYFYIVNFGDAVLARKMIMLQ